jgi:hypothetical protein
LLTPVPEPTTVTLFACAAALLASVGGRCTWRRPAGDRCARICVILAGDARRVRRRTSVVKLAIALHLGALDAHAIEIVYGGTGIQVVDPDDGTLARQIAGPFTSPTHTNGVVYWDSKIYAERKTGPMSKAVYEVNLDGSGFMHANNVPAPVTYAFQRYAVSADGLARYYVDPQEDRIVRETLLEFEPISETTVVETDDFHPGLGDIALDERNGKVYWFGVLSPFEGGVIQRANFDGTGLETLIDNSDGINPDYSPVNLELDVARGKLYWSSVEGGIWRANLDGTNMEVAIPNVGFGGFALIVDPVPEPAPWLLALGAAGALCVVRPCRR